MASLACMEPQAGQHPWFAVRVRSNFERTVSRFLRQKGYEEFAPFYRAKRRWSDRIREVDIPLFPGYVFCRFDTHLRLPILTTPGVVSIVGYGKEPAPVEENELADIQKAVGSGHRIQPWRFLRVGQKVRLLSGALYGLEGLLLSQKNRKRMIISVNLLQRSVAVEIDREDVEPVL